MKLSSLESCHRGWIRLNQMWRWCHLSALQIFSDCDFCVISFVYRAFCGNEVLSIFITCLFHDVVALVAIFRFFGIYCVFTCILPCKSSRSSDFCTRFSRETYLGVVHHLRIVLRIGWLSQYTNRAFRDFPSWTSPQFSVFVYNYWKHSAGAIDSRGRLHTSETSLALFVSVTERFKKNWKMTDYDLIAILW